MKEHAQHLLKKYLQGTASSEERAKLLEHLRASGDEDTYRAVMDQLWAEQAEEKHLSDAKAAELLQRVFRSSKKQRVAPYWYRVAAVLGGLMVLASLFYLITTGNERATLSYTTDYGETKTIWLPDSSKVILNANSTLTFSTDEQQTREAWLDGEAFFEIKKLSHSRNAAQPVKFVVHTDNLDVEVLGTAFNVNERRGATQVVLEHGKVRLATKHNEQIMMQPGDLVALASPSAALTTQVVDPKDYTVWQEKKLVFKRTPITEVATMMEDYYGWEVILSDGDWADHRITGSIPTYDEEIFLEVLTESMGGQAIREGNRVTLQKSNDPPPRE
ncbi:MAG: FecR domain-containing protein [Tunicatimonas sp.]